MADGNDFFNLLLWPAVETLFCPERGERLLDVACGNGLTSRNPALSGPASLDLIFLFGMLSFRNIAEAIAW